MNYRKDAKDRLLLTDKQASELYLIYLNDFLSTEKFAEYLGTTKNDAINIIDRGRLCHESQFRGK